MNAEVRQLHVVGDYLYAVVGDTLYKIDSNGAWTAISGTLSTSTGPVFMADNGTELMVVDPDVEGYIYEKVAGGSLTAIADADFPTPSSLTFLDGYFIVSEKDTAKFWISALYDGTDWTATDFATAESHGDNLVAVFASHGELGLFGEKSIEVWINTGHVDFPFEKAANISIEQGLRARHSIGQVAGMILFLSDTGKVMLNQGYQPVPVSTPSLEYLISSYDTIDDAIGFGYSDEGHHFYVLIFPSADRTWTYDLTTEYWHQRRSYPVDANGDEGRHRANCYALFNDEHIIGDFGDATLYKWKRDVYKDAGETIRRIRTAPVIHADRKNISFSRFEVDFESGTGLIETGNAWEASTAYSVDDRVIPTTPNECVYKCTSAGTSGASEPSWTIVAGDTITDGGVTWECQGTNPQAILSWSNDGGHTFGNEHWTTIGGEGERLQRAVWRRLGRSRNRVFRVEVSDPVKVVMIAAHLEAIQGYT